MSCRLGTIVVEGGADSAFVDEVKHSRAVDAAINALTKFSRLQSDSVPHQQMAGKFKTEIRYCSLSAEGRSGYHGYVEATEVSPFVPDGLN